MRYGGQRGNAWPLLSELVNKRDLELIPGGASFEDFEDLGFVSWGPSPKILAPLFCLVPIRDTVTTFGAIRLRLAKNIPYIGINPKKNYIYFPFRLGPVGALRARGCARMGPATDG